MLRTTSFVAVLCFTAALSALLGPASAQGKLWKQAGGWDIHVAGQGTSAFCMASAGYESGTMVFVTVSPAQRSITLTLAHERWRSVEDGREYPVMLSFDGVRSTEKMYGTHFGNSRGVEAHLTLSGVVKFMAANSMAVTYKGENVARLNLKGTYAAMLELKSCQEAANPDGWPFVKDTSGDPFRR